MKNLIFSALLLFAASADAAVGAARIKGTLLGSNIAGTVTFEDANDGVKVTAHLTGLPAGTHGFHVHEFGSCEDAGKAAGDHYNPFGRRHGQVLADGARNAHSGDMGNITTGTDGTATLIATIPKASVSGGKSAFAGRSVVIHEAADDFSQPSGNAGGRIACGVIVIVP